MKSHLFLNIAGFNIELYFSQTDYIYHKEKLINDIIRDFKGFIINRTKGEITYKIRFVEKTLIENLSRNNLTKHFIKFYENVAENEIISFYHISILQFQIIIRNIIQDLLVKSGGYILHASASKINNKAFIFLGKPNSGKSTIIKLLNKKYTALADDTVILKKDNNTFCFYQSPFIEKEYWVKKSKKSFRLAGVFLLRKSNNFRITKITNKEYILRIMVNQLLTEKDNLKKQLKYLGSFVSSFNNFYFLDFAQNSKKLIRIIEII